MDGVPESASDNKSKRITMVEESFDYIKNIDIQGQDLKKVSQPKKVKVNSVMESIYATEPALSNRP